jgi:hypothetical protein
MPVNGNIRKFRFDLSLNDRKIFDDLGDHLIELTKTKLIKIVEDVAERTGQKDLVLDKLEIDIGLIDINNLDSLTKAFEKELLLFFQKKEQQLQPVGSKKQEQALLFFIEKGYYPWWINNRQRFNSVVLDLEATTTFSDQFLATVFSDQKKYFRLVDTLEPAAKKNFINKLLGSNLIFFQSLIRFFIALQTSQIITSQSESSTSQLRAFEYNMIHQMGVLKQVDKQGIFYSAMEYISKTFNIPLAFLLSMLSEKLDVAKLDSEIKTALNTLFGQKQEIDQKEWKDIPSLNTASNQNSLFSIMGSSSSSAGSKTSTHPFFNAVLQYLEKGIFENSFDVINDYKIKFEFLIRSNSIRLIQHLSTAVFLKSKIKMERLATLSSNLSLDQLTDWLDTDKEAKGIIEDLRKIFSNKEFKDALAYYDAKIFSQTFFRKAILAALLRRKEQYEAGSTFVNTIIQEYTKTGSIERNELLLELYRMGDKKNYNQASNRLFEALFSSSSSSALDTVVRKGEDTMATESAETRIGERFSKLDEVSKMNVQDRINFLLSIFSQLRDTTDDLKQFQFPRSLLAYLDASLLERFFKRVKSQINFSIVKLIDELIKEYALAFDKKEILRIYQVAFDLLMMKPNILNSSQFKEELIKRLLELEPSIKIPSPALKKDPKSKALQDLRQLEAMKKEELNQWVVGLFLELPDTKKELEQLLFQRAFSSIINFPVMKAVFQQLNKKMKFDVIEKVEALINMAKGDQKELLRQQGFRSSFQILTSKGIQISSEQFSEALQQDLIRYDPQSFESETKSSTEKTKKESAVGKMNKEISALQDVRQLKAMKKEELNQWVEELFLELPDTKKELEQLLFQRAFSSIINFTVMKAVLQQLNKKMKFDVIEKVDALIDMAKDDQKKFLRQQGFRSSFLILTSKGIQISSDQFSKALQQDLIRQYPQSFESETKSSAEKAKKDSVIGEMIKEISKRIDGNAQKNSETISIEKFETLLQLKQDILINSEEYDTETLDISFESYADIILSKENFLRFLKTHFQDHELMMAFAEIGLQPENIESLEKLVDSETGIFDFEKRLLELQSQFNIVVLPHKSFKVILRTFILKKIGAKGAIQELTELEIVIDLFESLKRENFINLQQLSIYLETKTKKPSEESLAKSLRIFTLKSKFTIPNSKVKDILYFKDLVFSYLKTDSIPSWANVENFDLNDVIIFIKTTINKEDRSYLLTLVRDPKISERLVSVIQAQNEKEKMKFLELVQQSYANFNLAVIIEELKIYFGKITLTNKTTNIDFFIDLILAQELWKQSSLLSFIERLVSFIPKKASLKKTELLKYLHDKGFNISKSFFQITKKQALSNQELIEVLKFFLETNNFPKNLLAQEDELQSQIQTLLLSQDAILESLLNEYSYKPKLFERLFTFVEFRDLFRFIEKNRIYELSIFAPLSIAIYELEDKKRFSKKEQAQLLVSLLNQFEKQVTEIKFKGFLIQMMQERSTQFEDLRVAIEKRVKKQTQEDKKLKNLFNEIKTLDQKSKNIVIQSIDPLNVLEYYLEIGSVNFESKPFTKKELFQALEQLIQQDLIITKRVLHQWVRSDLKLNRLLDLIPPRKKFFIVELIHSELVPLIDLFSMTILQFFDTPIEKVLSIKNDKEYQRKILKYWANRNIFLDSPFEIMVLLFEEILSAEKISSKTFFDKQLDTEEELPLQMSNFLSSLKRNYANFKNQLSEELFLKEEEGGLEEENETDSIVIQNAGLIILWPFFFRLFDKCGFIIDKEFKDEESLQKGILLTQYLVTGSSEFNENELVLNKILCGAPQFMNVDVTLEVDEVYLDLCESLLKGVLKNWEKLSNSSVQTLRETFLIREGILRPVELDYKLNVIKGTFDMLIETIPWNISIIQTTFMKNKINVDWK